VDVAEARAVLGIVDGAGWDDVRAAKEMLSRSNNAPIPVPGQHMNSGAEPLRRAGALMRLRASPSSASSRTAATGGAASSCPGLRMRS
jgi:hypothetical protein